MALMNTTVCCEMGRPQVASAATPCVAAACDTVMVASGTRMVTILRYTTKRISSTIATVAVSMTRRSRNPSCSRSATVAVRPVMWTVNVEPATVWSTMPTTRL
ncbi:Uncharacterised protein [Mycobacteroides abscessus subsp. abscessus]|nr:Uncharacterised protein [Mycobacteroides abscessus subsp. abscessus]